MEHLEHLAHLAPTLLFLAPRVRKAQLVPLALIQ
jgi:hypothetical protein